MTRKNSKRTKRRILFFFILTIVVLSTFSVNLLKILIQIKNNNNEAEELRIAKKKYEREESYLKTEVEKFNDSEYIAKYAREKYFYSKNGEYTIRIPEAQP